MPRPRVIINLAITADGKLGFATGESSRFSSGEDLARLLEIRQMADAILVGRGTLEADRMTMKSPGREGSQPLRCVISRSGRFNPRHPLFVSPGGPIHLFVTDSPTIEPPSLAKKVAEVHHCELPAALAWMHAQGVRTLLCEGGGELVRALMKLDAVDTFHLTWAGHVLAGGASAPNPTGSSHDFLIESERYRLESFRENGQGELFLEYRRGEDANPDSCAQ